jgi:hypothetical protein
MLLLLLLHLLLPTDPDSRHVARPGAGVGSVHQDRLVQGQADRLPGTEW